MVRQYTVSLVTDTDARHDGTPDPLTDRRL